MWERIFKGISHQKSKGMKNLTSLCAAWPLSPSCSGFPFRTAKPYLSCLVINPVCSHQGFSWKKQSQWWPVMSKSTFNCGTAWSCSKVGVGATRSAPRCVTAVVLIKWSISNFARVSEVPPIHLSTGDQSHHQTLWLPEQVISIWPSAQQQMANDFVWVSTNMQCEEQFPRNHGEGRGKVWSEVFFLKLLMGGRGKTRNDKCLSGGRGRENCLLGPGIQHISETAERDVAISANQDELAGQWSMPSILFLILFGDRDSAECIQQIKIK